MAVWTRFHLAVSSLCNSELILVRGWCEVFIRAPKKFGGVLLGQIGSSASYLLLDHKYAGLFGISPSKLL